MSNAFLLVKLSGMQYDTRFWAWSATIIIMLKNKIQQLETENNQQHGRNKQSEVSKIVSTLGLTEI